MDYRKMYDDKEHLYAYDLEELPGRTRTLEIAGVSRGELTGEKNRKTKKPMISFVGEPKKLACNKTNGKTIAALYGKDTERWIGEFITIYATTTEFGGETVDCIRVRPQRPDRPERGATGKSNGGGGRQSGQAKRATPTAGQHLVSLYEACDSEERLAELKVMRGQYWDRFDAATRESVAAAAQAAKARIDAAASTGSRVETTPGAAPDPDGDLDAGGSTPVDAEEKAEIARLEREAAARG